MEGPCSSIIILPGYIIRAYFTKINFFLLLTTMVQVFKKFVVPFSYYKKKSNWFDTFFNDKIHFENWDFTVFEGFAVIFYENIRSFQ